MWRRWFPDRTRTFQPGDRVFRIQRSRNGPQLIERIVEQQGIDRDEYLTRGPNGELESGYWLPDAFNRNPRQALEAARAQADAGVRALRRERMERILLRPRPAELERQIHFDRPLPLPRNRRPASGGAWLLRGLALHLSGYARLA